MTARVVSFITKKGGVGKTTLTYLTGEFLAREIRRADNEMHRVLLIDMDEQCNLSTVMVGGERWKEAHEAGQTTFQMFYDALHNTKVFDIEKAIIPTNNIRSPGKIDVLPCSIRLQDLKADLKGVGQNTRFRTLSPTNVLERHLNKVKDNYDYILIDCPPDMGYPTLNALAVSDGYIIPTYPEFISVFGIPQVLKIVKEFSEELGREIVPYGIVINRFRNGVNYHNATVRNLKADKNNPPIFDTLIIERAPLGESAEFTEYISTMKGKFGNNAQGYETYRRFVQEFIEKVNLKESASMLQDGSQTDSQVETNVKPEKVDLTF